MNGSAGRQLGCASCSSSCTTFVLAADIADTSEGNGAGDSLLRHRSMTDTGVRFAATVDATADVSKSAASTSMFTPGMTAVIILSRRYASRYAHTLGGAKLL